MKNNRKYEPIKESRGWYFVEYSPPVSDFKWATLNLVITEDAHKIDIVNAMERELQNWLQRYPIPLFISAFDNKGDRYDLSEIRPNSYLIGFFDRNNKICLHWESIKDEEIPDIASNEEYVDKLYSNLVFKTYAELDVEHKKRRKQIKTGWYIFFIWLVVVPAVIAILEFYSSWLSLVALIYSLYKALQIGLELSGKWQKSKREKEKEREEQLKNHYYYHCQMNPEGFNRLMIENLEKMSKAEITKEAELLKTSKS